MRAYEFISEGPRGMGGTIVKTIDPLAHSMKLFKPRKAKQTPDTEASPFRKYPKRMYATTRLVSKEQREALEADDEFKRLRAIYQKAEKDLTSNPKSMEHGHRVGLATIANNAVDAMAKRRDEVLQQAGLPSIYE